MIRALFIIIYVVAIAAPAVSADYPDYGNGYKFVREFASREDLKNWQRELKACAERTMGMDSAVCGDYEIVRDFASRTDAKNYSRELRRKDCIKEPDSSTDCDYYKNHEPFPYREPRVYLYFRPPSAAATAGTAAH